MHFLEKRSLLERLHELIRRCATGTAAQCAKRLEISRAGFYRHLDMLKMFGAEIKYCRYKKTYRYATDFQFKM